MARPAKDLPESIDALKALVVANEKLVFAKDKVISAKEQLLLETCIRASVSVKIVPGR